jgi:hypothetical protein
VSKSISNTSTGRRPQIDSGAAPSRRPSFSPTNGAECSASALPRVLGGDFHLQARPPDFATCPLVSEIAPRLALVTTTSKPAFASAIAESRGAGFFAKWLLSVSFVDREEDSTSADARGLLAFHSHRPPATTATAACSAVTQVKAKIRIVFLLLINPPAADHPAGLAGVGACP